MRTPITREPEAPPGSTRAFVEKLIDEEKRLAVGAKLEWIEYARTELAKLLAQMRRP
jgi:hypothetical protein